MPPTDPARRKFLAALLAVPVISSCTLNEDKKSSNETTTGTAPDAGTDSSPATDTATGTDTNPATDTNNGTTKPDATPQPDTSVGKPINLTGLWGWTKPGLYKLKQSGASVQGTYFDPDIPDARGAIAGSIAGNVIKMTVSVTYATRPQDNFTAIKTGTIHSSNSMTLTVTGGTKYVGQVQKWSKLATI